jgi:hypothetical protein
VNLFPPKIISRDPNGLAGVDSAGFCHCDDGADYALKDGDGHPAIPHCEWFCTKLAETVGIICPPCTIVEDLNGKTFFGSRWEGGVSNERWWDAVRNGDMDFDNVAAFLSRVLAFDHFVHNDDRHLGNYIVRDSKSDPIMLALDFSRAWLYHDFPLPGLPFSASDNTLSTARMLRSHIGDYVIMPEVHRVLDRIQQIPTQNAHELIEQHPESWLPDDLKKQVLAWWDSNDRLERIEIIRKGIGDGTFL